MQITISVKTDTGGLEKIIANCDNLTPQIVESAGVECAAAAVIFAPWDTGALRDSIESKMVSALLARINAQVEYDIYQELGTYKMAAHPFLAPAVEMVAVKFLSPSTWSPLIYGGGFGAGADLFYKRQGGSHMSMPVYLGSDFSVGGGV
jgi:hypothetical protein